MDNSFSLKTYMFKMTPDFHKAFTDAAARQGITLQEYMTIALQAKMIQDSEA